MFAEILEIRYLTFYDNISFFTSLGKKKKKLIHILIWKIHFIKLNKNKGKK